MFRSVILPETERLYSSISSFNSKSYVSIRILALSNTAIHISMCVCGERERERERERKERERVSE